MAKRYTDSEKFKDEWFGSLSNDYRIIWVWLLDNCSFAGIWKKDFRGLNFNCNTQVTEDQFKEVFGSRVVDRTSYFFIPKFVKFQYPSGLNSQKPMIASVRKELISKNLHLVVNKSFGNDYLMIPESINNGIKTIKEKDMVKEKEKVKDKGVQGEKVEEYFDTDSPNYVPSEKRKVFTPPTFVEFEAYCIASGFSGIAERAYKGYADADWHDSGGKKVKSWKQKLQHVWFNEKNKGNGKSTTNRQQAADSVDALVNSIRTLRRDPGEHLPRGDS